MQLILDTGNISEIKDLYNTLAIDGVTTNLSIVAKEGLSAIKELKEKDIKLDQRIW